MAAATYQGSVPTRREETGRQLQTRVLHSNQDLEFIDKMMEYGKFKHILQARLEEMRKIEAFVERDIEDLQRDYEKTKKATKEKLEELIKLRAFVERDIEDLQRDYEKTKKATKEKIEELDELRECAERYEKELMEVIEDDEEKWKDHRGLNKEDHFENDEKLPVDSHKRTLLQRLKDLCSKNLRKKKKSIAEAPTNFVSFEPKDEEKGLAVRACGGSHIRDLVQQDMVRRQDKLRGLKGPSRWSIGQ
ncbi:centlein-like isoform X3 [Stylophora pistillata]|uniref:centlein-like isoform X3 n=1 Tax=Stylophora pistillata TaxID=50429 RepID=UPI000C04366C|nr:centlein-like isoform X3 [Stylophora pistillata]